MKRLSPWLAVLLFGAVARAAPPAAPTAFAPDVPPPIGKRAPLTLRLALDTPEKEMPMMEGLEKPTLYKYWTFNSHVPGPFVRARLGDTLEVHLSNPKSSLMIHNVDLHAVTGPGGGAAATLAPPGVTKVARFKMLNAGLFVYHCAAPPVTHHIANGMYGLILVEPEEGMPPADREFYVMQSEFYTKGAFGAEGAQEFDPAKAEAEHPTYVVFNGRVGAIAGKNALKAKTGERVRIYFGNGGPNLTSSFHVIGEIFDTVYAEASLRNPLHDVQTTLVPAGGAAIVEFKLEVPGSYTLLDHAIFRIQKGCVGSLEVEGPPNPTIYEDVRK